MKLFLNIRAAIAAAVLALVLTGCRTVPVSPSAATLSELCEQYGLAWQLDSVSQVVTLRRGSKEAKALIGSEVVLLDNERIYLSEPVNLVRGGVLVPADFEEKILRALVGTGTRPARVERRFTKIVVDAGHGGKDPGATGPSGIREKEIVLDIAKRLKRKLEQKGFEVVMTRDRDEFLTLGERTEVASKAKADLFISVHANSSPSRSISGVEVYNLREMTMAEKREDQRRKNHQLLFNKFSMSQDNSDLKAILEDMMFTYKVAEEPKLSARMADSLSKRIGTTNRGARTAGFFVLRNTLIPSILVEVGYLTNPKEERMLKTGEFREKVADGVADVIADYSKI